MVYSFETNLKDIEQAIREEVTQALRPKVEDFLASIRGEIEEKLVRTMARLQVLAAHSPDMLLVGLKDRRVDLRISLDLSGNG